MNLWLQFSFLSFAEDSTTHQKQSAVQRVVTPVMTDHILLSFPSRIGMRTLSSPGICSQGSCSLLLGATPEYSVLGVSVSWGDFHMQGTGSALVGVGGLREAPIMALG